MWAWLSTCQSLASQHGGRLLAKESADPLPAVQLRRFACCLNGGHGFVDQVGTQFWLVLFNHRCGGLHHASVLCGLDFVELHACFHQVLHHFSFHLAADLAVVGLRFFARGFQHIALFGVQAVPEFLADQQNIGPVDVIGRTDKFLDFVKLVGVNSLSSDLLIQR